MNAESVAKSPTCPSHEGVEWMLELPFGDTSAPKAQPPFVPHRGVLSFFEGILHDRAKLLRELNLDQQADNAEIVAAGYARWGRDLLSRLRGAFVVAIVDPISGQGLIARDPLGSSPLYYTVIGGVAAFAGDPETLLRRPGVCRDLNRTALADRLCYRWLDGEETYFAAVKRVPPGSCALIIEHEIRITRYWDPVPDDQPVNWQSSAEAFSATFDRAVERCLETGRTGVFLSGGLDSISIAAIAADLARKIGHPSPVALSLGFPEPGCDERLIQSAVARQLHLSYQLVDFWEAVGHSHLLADTLALNRSLAAPILNVWAPAYLSLASRGRRVGVRTVLTGSGGDEWLSVSPYLAADMIRRADVPALARFAATWHRSYQQPWSRVAQRLGWQYGLRPVIGLLLHRIAPSLWNARRVRRVTRQDPSWVAPDPTVRAEQKRRAPRTLSPSDPSHGFYLQDVRTGIEHSVASLEMEEQFQFGRRLGVRFLHPYWDADLVDTLYRMPPQLLQISGHSKAPVRQMLSARFPTLGFERQRKVIATSFFERLLQTEAPQALARHGGFETLGNLGVVDAKHARRFAEVAFRDSGHDMYRAWELLNVESWAQSHAS